MSAITIRPRRPASRGAADRAVPRGRRFTGGFAPALVLVLTVLGAPAAADGVGAAGARQLAQAGGTPCGVVRRVEVESQGALSEDASYSAIRERVVKQALTLAVALADVGPPTTAAEADTAVSGPALDYATARKLVRSYEILSQDIIRKDDTDYLRLGLAAEVCAPGPGPGPGPGPQPGLAALPAPATQIVAVGDFIDGNGRSLSGARRQLLDFFSTLGNDPRFTFTETHPAAAPAHIIITGRILDAKGSQSSQRVTVRIELAALFQSSGRVISAVGEGNKRKKRNTDPLRYVPEAVRRAIEKAGPTIYVGIEAARGP